MLSSKATTNPHDALPDFHNALKRPKQFKGWTCITRVALALALLAFVVAGLQAGDPVGETAQRTYRVGGTADRTLPRRTRLGAVPTHYAVLFVTITKGYILRCEKPEALARLLESGRDVNLASIHGLRPHPDERKKYSCRMPKLSEELKSEIHDVWYNIDDDEFNVFKSVGLVWDQIVKHGWKIHQFRSAIEYIEFTLDSFYALDLNKHLTQIRQEIDPKYHFRDFYGQSWCSILGDHLLKKLQRVYTFVPVLIVFRKKRRPNLFIKEMKFCYDLTAGVSVDSSVLFSHSAKILKEDGSSLNPLTEYVNV